MPRARRTASPSSCRAAHVRRTSTRSCFPTWPPSSAHAPFKSALCLAAAAYFERQAQQTVAVLLLGLDVCELATQFRYPMSAEIARWPSVDAFVANRHMVPILFAQVMILSLALVVGCADDPRAGGGRAAEPSEERIEDR